MSGAHQWTMAGVWALTEAEAATIVRGALEEPVPLTGANLLTVDGPGCYRCEVMYREPHTAECPSEDPPLARDVSKVMRLGTTEHIRFER